MERQREQAEAGERPRDGNKMRRNSRGMEQTQRELQLTQILRGASFAAVGVPQTDSNRVAEIAQANRTDKAPIFLSCPFVRSSGRRQRQRVVPRS